LVRRQGTLGGGGGTGPWVRICRRTRPGRSPLDIARLRAETPGVAHRVHLNNAGASLMPEPVVRAVREHLELEATIGGYEAAAERADAIEEAYAHVAALLGTEPHRIAFT